MLLDKLQPGQPVEAQSNAAEILAALAQSQVSPLTRNLAEPQFLELLVERALRQPAQAASRSAASEASEPAAAPAANGTSSTGAAASAGALPLDAADAKAAAAANSGHIGSSGSSAMMHVSELEGWGSVVAYSCQPVCGGDIESASQRYRLAACYAFHPAFPS